MLECVTPYLMAGIACLPAANKHPIVEWTRYTKEFPHLSLFNAPPEQLAVVCGQISGNLEVIDIDNKWDKTGDVLNELLKVGDAFDLRLCVNKSRNNGYHLFYRCEEISGNQKLAKISKGTSRITVIETRGEGGIIIVPPSDGYATIKGSMLNIPTITKKKRKILLEVAKTFNEEINRPVYNYISSGNGIKDRFNALMGVDELAKNTLVRAGWQFVGKRGVKRPGKKEFGISATWGYTPAPYFFYVFSSNAYPFEEKKAYSPYQIICILDFNGNWGDMRKYAEEVLSL